MSGKRGRSQATSRIGDRRRSSNPGREDRGGEDLAQISLASGKNSGGASRGSTVRVAAAVATAAASSSMEAATAAHGHKSGLEQKAWRRTARGAAVGVAAARAVTRAWRGEVARDSGQSARHGHGVVVAAAKGSLAKGGQRQQARTSVRMRVAGRGRHCRARATNSLSHSQSHIWLSCSQELRSRNCQRSQIMRHNDIFISHT
ncbi:hypothetical protein NL676_011679 [Syzygium grande]|nr:hypothetical protein NL676_011679 [Syzygium grande]